MGCCQSTTHVDENDTVRPGHLSTSQSDAALTGSQPASRPDSNLTTQVSTSAATSKRPNKPIRAPSPPRSVPSGKSYVNPPPWTRAQLAFERTAFFDTRVSGQQEVWTALKLVAELLQRGNVADAQGILDAMSLTCPSGRVAAGGGEKSSGGSSRSGRARERSSGEGGVFDERGELYEMPAWVVSDPEDLVVVSAAADGVDNTDGSAAASSDLLNQNKGKERVGAATTGDSTAGGERMRLRLRLSDRGTDVIVSVGTKDPVLAIVKKIRDQIGPQRVRLMYLGRILQESKTLESQGFQSGNVINAFVFEGTEDMLKKEGVK